MAIVGIPYVNLEKMMAVLVLGLCCFSVSAASDGVRTAPSEVQALRIARRSLIDPFNNLRNWARGDPCTSNWTGIICYNTTLDDGLLHVREMLFLTRNLSGSLSPALGNLSYLKILDFMWNNINGSIPKEIGNLSSLELLLLSGNQLTGPLPDELGNLSHMNRIQVDQNQISGPVPATFANLANARHFHMNNNSLSGQIPPELSRLPKLVHLLLDNNNLSGYIPTELLELPSIQIIQLDNNNFGETTIPSQLGNSSTLLKLSLRNCSLRGHIPDMSNNTRIAYIDLSCNQLEGNIPSGSLSQNITTIDISNNNLTGSIPSSFSSLPLLQKLSLANNSMNGSIPSTIWQRRTLNSNQSLSLDFSFNRFSNISGSLPAQPNIILGLQGNPLCSSNSYSAVCGPHQDGFRDSLNNTNTSICLPQSCLSPYEYAPPCPQTTCFCAAPLLIGYRLKSPGFSNFAPYMNNFVDYLSSVLNVNAYQLEIDSLAWQEGPRLRMYLKLFPSYVNDSVDLFNMSEVWRIQTAFSGWRIRGSPVFGPYELLNFTLTEPYMDELPPTSSGLSNGALAGVIVGTIAGSVIITALVSFFAMKRHMKKRGYFKREQEFTYLEMAHATHNFDSSTVVGEGGYGKVHRGTLADGTIVAIKRAEEGSLQGVKEFLTEIELLSRLHHRNLVSLIGYCDEQGEQMLIYEFVPNGNLRDNLSGKSRVPLSFGMRVKIALGAARGIFYLHKEANPPIFHRDIKATNILLDSYFTAKVADFGLSRLAPLQDLEGSVPSHVSTVVKGTPGYLDPEYFLTHKLTDKSDVYSLGVVLLELMTAMHPISQGKNIVREVNIAYRSGRMCSVIDEGIGSYPFECVEKFINLALKCCSDETHARPTMAEVVRELDSILMMTTDWDTNFSTSLDSDHSRVGTSRSSSASAPLIVNQPYSSHEISGSDLVSGVFPTAKPR